MVAVLVSFGADINQEPTAYVPSKSAGGEAAEGKVSLGKCARALALEMAADVSNPLHREAKAMLTLMIEPGEASRRITTLQARLEVELAKGMQSAAKRTLLALVTTIAVGAVYWFYILPLDAGATDTREL